MSRGAEIVFDRVTKRYPGRDGAALHELSLTIPAGTFCVLVGPSGGGKTTALKLVNRLIPFDEGDIRIDGRSIRELPAVELRRGIGYVIQQVGPLPAHDDRARTSRTVPRLLGWDRRPGSRPARAELLELVGLERGRREALPDPALGRPAPARRARPRARRRPAAAADGRAVRRARPDHPRAPAGRAAAAAPRGREDGHLRHPRHRRGDQDGRPDRDPARGRRARPVRHAGRDPRPPGRRVRRPVHRRGPRAAAARAAARSATSSSSRSANRADRAARRSSSTTVRNARLAAARRPTATGSSSSATTATTLGVLTLASGAAVLLQ